MTLQRIVVNHMEQNANIFNHFVEHEDILEITPTKYYQNMKKIGSIWRPTRDIFILPNF